MASRGRPARRRWISASVSLLAIGAAGCHGAEDRVVPRRSTVTVAYGRGVQILNPSKDVSAVSTVAHERLRGLGTPYRFDPVWYMEGLWLEDRSSQ